MGDVSVCLPLYFSLHLWFWLFIFVNKTRAGAIEVVVSDLTQ